MWKIILLLSILNLFHPGYGTCLSCRDGAYLNSVGYCQQCNSNCATCSNNSTCITCAPAYYNSTHQTCEACSSQCLQCTSAANCQSCAEGYYLDSNNKCQQLTNQNCDNCLNCSSQSQSQSQSVCTSCQDGYILNATMCVACPPNCGFCSSPTWCTSCLLPSYTINSSGACVWNTKSLCGNYGDYCDNCTSTGSTPPIVIALIVVPFIIVLLLILVIIMRRRIRRIFCTCRRNPDQTGNEGLENLIKRYISDLKQEVGFLHLISEKSNGQIKTQCVKPQPQQQRESILNYVLKSNEDNQAEIHSYKEERRKRVEETTHFPHSVHGVVKSTFGNFCKTGTGIVIGSNLVLTAAHNLFHNQTQKGKLEFIPAMNGKTAPFGSFNILESYSQENWENDDYALLVTDGSVGTATGYFGLHIAKKDHLIERVLKIVGYPAYVRNPEGLLVLLSQRGDHQQWGDEGKPIVFEENGLISYQIFTTGGQSGSGVFYHDLEADCYYVVGIHVLKNVELNSATWITEERFRQIECWIRDYRCKRILEKMKKRDFKKLVALRLLDTNIGTIEAEILASFEMRNLQLLFLSENCINEESKSILKKASPKIKIFVDY